MHGYFEIRRTVHTRISENFVSETREVVQMDYRTGILVFQPVGSTLIQQGPGEYAVFEQFGIMPTLDSWTDVKTTTVVNFPADQVRMAERYQQENNRL